METALRVLTSDEVICQKFITDLFLCKDVVISAFFLTIQRLDVKEELRKPFSIKRLDYLAKKNVQVEVNISWESLSGDFKLYFSHNTSIIQRVLSWQSSQEYWESLSPQEREYWSSAYKRSAQKKINSNPSSVGFFSSSTPSIEWFTLPVDLRDSISKLLRWDNGDDFAGLWSNLSDEDRLFLQKNNSQQQNSLPSGTISIISTATPLPVAISTIFDASNAPIEIQEARKLTLRNNSLAHSSNQV